jgi:hypothetical protein
MQMLTEGRADAVPTGLNTSLSLQVNSSLPGGIRYIQMGRDEPRLAQIMPGSRVVAVEPAANGVGMATTTRVSGILDYLNASTHMPDDEAYAIIKTIHENWEDLRRDYSQIRPVTAAEVVPDELTHPFHPGAIRYFREAGLWTDAHESQQLDLLALHDN